MQNGKQKTHRNDCEQSSREKEIRRREEGRTTCSQKTISLKRNQGEGKDRLMKVDDDLPTCMRNSRNNNDDETKRMEDLRGKGGRRLKHRTIDGDVPLCLRKIEKDSNDDSSSEGKKREEGKRKQHSEQNEALCHEQSGERKQRCVRAFNWKKR